jgi:hypothetical protein
MPLSRLTADQHAKAILRHGKLDGTFEFYPNAISIQREVQLSARSDAKATPYVSRDDDLAFV